MNILIATIETAYCPMGRLGAQKKSEIKNSLGFSFHGGIVRHYHYYFFFSKRKLGESDK